MSWPRHGSDVLMQLTLAMWEQAGTCGHSDMQRRVQCEILGYAQHSALLLFSLPALTF